MRSLSSLRALGLIGLTLAGSLLHVSAQAESLRSGLITEAVFAGRVLSHGADGGAQVHRMARDSGLGQIDLVLPLIQDLSGTRVYPAPLRSSIKDLDSALSRARLLSLEVGFVPQFAEPFATPPGQAVDRELLTATYLQALAPYHSLARKREIARFSLGSAQLLERLTLDALVDWIGSGGRGPKYSLEVRDSLDLEALERLNGRENSKSLQLLLSKVDQIVLGVSDPASLASKVSRVRAIAPQSWIRVSLPGLKAFDADAVLASLNRLPVDLRTRLSGVRVDFGTTDADEQVRAGVPPAGTFAKIFPDHIFLPVPPESLFQSLAPGSVACIFFDRASPSDSLGAIHARMLESLIGAVPRYTVERHGLSTYRPGILDRCSVAFVIRTDFFAEHPATLQGDVIAYLKSGRSLVWMNYGFDRLVGESTPNPFGFAVPMIQQPDEAPTAQKPDGGFFKEFLYKGETFRKLAEWDPTSARLRASPELAVVAIRTGAPVEVLSTAVHSRSGKTTPYVVRDRSYPGSLWYFADSPFSYIHYEDRYLIFCDLLWDILGESPPDHPPVALLRIEDLNPAQNTSALRTAVDMLASRGTPFSVALIPVAADASQGHSAPITEYKSFLGMLKYIHLRGADFVFHGVSHQAGDLISGYLGSSGTDYEFWRYPENTPRLEDSSDFVLDLLERGERVFQDLRIRPLAWEVPHYAASALDYTLFGSLFEYQYHRSLIFDAQSSRGPTHPAEALSETHRMFSCLSSECRAERRERASQVRVTVEDPSRFGGQILPYPVTRDTYGQAIIPETLGMVDYPMYSTQTWRPVSRPEDLLRRAKLLRVVRGAMASFFWHPDILSPTLPYYVENPGHYERFGGIRTLTSVVEGLEKLGYTFRSIADCKLFPRHPHCPN